jgi:hypothetical protein
MSFQRIGLLVEHHRKCQIAWCGKVARWMVKHEAGYNPPCRACDDCLHVFVGRRRQEDVATAIVYLEELKRDIEELAGSEATAAAVFKRVRPYLRVE